MAADVSTALPDLDLRENSIVTVTLDAAGATITRLVVHGWQEDTLVSEAPPKATPAYSTG